MTTSLTSGTPRRDTWTYGPETVGLAPEVWYMRVWGTHVSDQTPTIELGSDAFVGNCPFFVTRARGICIPIVWVLKPATPLMPPPWLPGRTPERKLSRSPSQPRSTKNMSLRGPAKTLMFPSTG